MKTRTRSLWLCAGATLLAVNAAYAQVPAPATEKFFVNFSLGSQLAERTLDTTSTKEVYDETATLNSSLPISKGGLFDLDFGYRVYGDVYVGLAVARFAHEGDATYTASVPDPVVFNRLRTSTGTETGLHRVELSFNPHVTWVMPLTDKFDISLGVGAAIIQLRQDLASDFTVPAGTQSVIPVISEERGTAKGFYGSVDLIYNLAARYGVGGFARYSGGKVDLTTSPDHNVGGMQVGGGIRLRLF